MGFYILLTLYAAAKDIVQFSVRAITGSHDNDIAVRTGDVSSHCCKKKKKKTKRLKHVLPHIQAVLIKEGLGLCSCSMVFIDIYAMQH